MSDGAASTRASSSAGIALRNPVLTASGTFGYGTEFAPFLDLRRIGGFVAKSLTLEPRRGNPPPRIAEAPSGMLNAISLENVGVDAFVREKLPALPEGVVVIASVFETEIERYAEVAKRLDGRAARRRARGQRLVPAREERRHRVRPATRACSARWCARCGAATGLPLLVKLSPNVTDIGEMARVCEGEGADGLSLINSVQALEVDVETAPSGALERARRSLGTGDPPDRAAHGLAGAPRGEAPDLRDRGDRQRRGRGEVPALRGDRGPGRAPRTTSTRPWRARSPTASPPTARATACPRVADLVGSARAAARRWRPCRRARSLERSRGRTPAPHVGLAPAPQF